MTLELGAGWTGHKLELKALPFKCFLAILPKENMYDMYVAWMTEGQPQFSCCKTTANKENLQN